MTTDLLEKKTKFQPGDAIVTCNLWTRWEMPKDEGPSFNWLKAGECEQLAPGDVVWVDAELHPNGKVYGCTAAVVKEIHGSLKNNDLYIIYVGNPSGLKRIDADREYTGFAQLDDETAALEFVNKHPLATNAGSFA